MTAGTGPATRPGPRPNSQPTGSAHSSLLLTMAAILLLFLAAAQGYVSFRAQYAFIDHAKRAHVPSLLEAVGLDTGAVIFALLALSLACHGRPGTVERVLNVACALGSLTMNLLAANLASPRSIAVWVMPSVLYASASDRLIAVVRRWALTSRPGTRPAEDGSAWRGLSGLALWLPRLVADPRGTLAGFRRWLLTAAPVVPGIRTAGAPAASRSALPRTNAGFILNKPSSPVTIDGLAWPGAGQGQHHIGPPAWPAPAPQGLEPGERKREALIRLYEQRGQDGDPRYGNRAKTSAIAGEIAALIGYHPGTARRELARYVTGQPAAEPSRPGPDLNGEETP